MAAASTSASWTPDNRLTLLFPPSLIPATVASALSSAYHIRPLASDDHHRGHLTLLRVLTQAPELDAASYGEVFDDMRCRGRRGGYYALVIVDKATDKLVGTGTLLIERKFIRNAGLVGHIEDIAVSKAVQGQKLGLRVIQALVGVGERLGCYKTILDCSAENVVFYEKCGFTQKELEMVKYAKTPLPTSAEVDALYRPSTPGGSKL